MHAAPTAHVRTCDCWTSNTGFFLLQRRKPDIARQRENRAPHTHSLPRTPERPTVLLFPYYTSARKIHAPPKANQQRWRLQAGFLSQTRGGIFGYYRNFRSNLNGSRTLPAEIFSAVPNTRTTRRQNTSWRRTQPTDSKRSTQ